MLFLDLNNCNVMTSYGRDITGDEYIDTHLGTAITLDLLPQEPSDMFSAQFNTEAWRYVFFLCKSYVALSVNEPQEQTLLWIPEVGRWFDVTPGEFRQYNAWHNSVEAYNKWKKYSPLHIESSKNK